MLSSPFYVFINIHEYVSYVNKIIGISDHVIPVLCLSFNLVPISMVYNEQPLR